MLLNLPLVCSDPVLTATWATAEFSFTNYWAFSGPGFWFGGSGSSYPVLFQFAGLGISRFVAAISRDTGAERGGPPEEEGSLHFEGMLYSHESGLQLVMTISGHAEPLTDSLPSICL